MLLRVFVTVVYGGICVFKFTYGDSGNLLPEYNMCRNVMGFCQRPFGATFYGGFFDSNRKQKVPNNYSAIDFSKACYTGIFGNESSETTGTLMPKSWCQRHTNKHKVGCFGIPQCGRGKFCSWDFSCQVSQANRIQSYFDSINISNIEYIGAFKFLDDSVREVKCQMGNIERGFNENGDGKNYLKGIRVIIKPMGDPAVRRDRACPRTDIHGNVLPSNSNPQSPFEHQNLYGMYTCELIGLTQHLQVKNGDTFVHEFSYSSAAACFPTISAACICVGIIAVLFGELI
jgi:hypothetical protein